MINKLSKRYEIISKIGSGGMSTIYLARDKYEQRNVAIKMLHETRKNDVINQKRFENEMKLSMRVHSPYVVKVFDYRNEPNARYIVLEYIEGDTLTNHIAYNSSLNVEETIEITKEIIYGVKAIHESGIIHRDLKASNIIINNEHQVKLIDLGIALAETTERVTRTDSIIGSSEYVAPEISRGEPPTIRSDIYSIGILMFQMLVGHVPFDGDTPFEILQKHIKNEIPNVSSISPHVPQSLSNIIKKATAKNPRQRYQNVDDFLISLENVLSVTRINERPLKFAEKKSRSFMEKINSKTFLIVAGVLLALIIILVIVVVLVK